MLCFAIFRHIGHFWIQKLEKGGHVKCSNLPIMGIWGGAPSRVQGRGSTGEAPLKLKAFWQSCAEFPLEYFMIFLNILLQRGMWSYWPQHMTGRGGGMAGSPPPPLVKF